MRMYTMMSIMLIMAIRIFVALSLESSNTSSGQDKHFTLYLRKNIELEDQGLKDEEAKENEEELLVSHIHIFLLDRVESATGKQPIGFLRMLEFLQN